MCIHVFPMPQCIISYYMHQYDIVCSYQGTIIARKLIKLALLRTQELQLGCVHIYTAASHRTLQSVTTTGSAMLQSSQLAPVVRLHFGSDVHGIISNEPLTLECVQLCKTRTSSGHVHV